MARTGVMGVSSPLWTRVGVMLVITSWGGGVGGVGGGWFCDFSKSEVPKYKDVMLEALKNYKANSNAKFYPMTSVYREMLDTMNCADGRQNKAGGPNTSETLPSSHQVTVWPQSRVPYVIDSLYPRNIKKRILDYMQAFMDDTCISFVERDKEDTYVTFIHPNNSKMIDTILVYEKPQEEYAMGTPTAGYTRGVVTQFVRTEADIMTRSSGIMQTLMFILGVPREENRFDRDKYIKLTFSEEDKRLRRIFQKNLMTKLDLDFPYDTLSAAHMTKKNAEDLRVGIESLDPAVHPIKEQVDSVLSQGDKKKLNYLYCGGSIDGSRDSSTRARANSPGLNNRTSGQESSGNQTGVSDGSNDSSSTGKNGTSNSNSQINTPSGGGVGGSGGGGDGGGGGGGGGGLSDGSGGGSGEVDGNGGEDYSDGENQGDDEILKDGMTDGSNSASERIFGILQVFLASAAVLVTLVTTLFAVTPSF